MSHPPKDGETFDTTCTAEDVVATCEGGGLVANADNADGFFKKDSRYVWYVRASAPDDTAGSEAGQPQSGG